MRDEAAVLRSIFEQIRGMSVAAIEQLRSRCDVELDVAVMYEQGGMLREHQYIWLFAEAERLVAINTVDDEAINAAVARFAQHMVAVPQPGLVAARQAIIYWIARRAKALRARGI